VGGKPAARKNRGHSKKITIGDDRYFVSALEQGFGPAFFFVFLVGVTFGSLCAVMGYFVYHKQLSVARPAGSSALRHVFMPWKPESARSRRNKILLVIIVNDPAMWQRQVSEEVVGADDAVDRQVGDGCIDVGNEMEAARPDP
jgi:hypothetical protein